MAGFPSQPMTPAEIKALRTALGLSQRDFGRALGLDGAHVKDTVSKWERGIGTGPSGPVLRVMAYIKSFGLLPLTAPP